MKISEVLLMLSTREHIRDILIDRLTDDIHKLKIVESFTEEIMVRVEDDTTFLAVYPSIAHGDWFLVESKAPRYTISKGSYKKAVIYLASTNTIYVISYGEPVKKVIEVPPL